MFVEEMVALAREAGDVSIPPTIRALLQARLDRLRPEERAVVDRGAVEGEVFHSGAVEELTPDGERSRLSSHLLTLVRKDVIRPDTAALPEYDAFRFRHLLIRDAAYDALPKRVRAELHERFATWLERHGITLVELDEHADALADLAYVLHASGDETGAREALDAALELFERRDATFLAATARARVDLPDRA